jgi:hypothetical protein
MDTILDFNNDAPHFSTLMMMRSAIGDHLLPIFQPERKHFNNTKNKLQVNTLQLITTRFVNNSRKKYKT